MHHRKKLISFGKLPRLSSARFKLLDRLEKPLGVGGAAQQIRSFFQRLEIFQRENHNRLVAVTCDDHRLMIVANTIHGSSQVGAGVCVSDSVHNILRTCTESGTTRATRRRGKKTPNPSIKSGRPKASFWLPS